MRVQNDPMRFLVEFQDEKLKARLEAKSPDTQVEVDDYTVTRDADTEEAAVKLAKRIADKRSVEVRVFERVWSRRLIALIDELGEEVQQPGEAAVQEEEYGKDEGEGEEDEDDGEVPDKLRSYVRELIEATSAKEADKILDRANEDDDVASALSTIVELRDALVFPD